jgi:hypothetical protein
VRSRALDAGEERRISVKDIDRQPNVTKYVLSMRPRVWTVQERISYIILFWLLLGWLAPGMALYVVDLSLSVRSLSKREGDRQPCCFM